MTKKKLNVKLLRKIQRHILAEPKRFIMDTWIRRGDPFEDLMMPDAGLPSIVLPACGTAACIGGWALQLSGKRIATNTPVAKRAKAILGITPQNDDDSWPEDRLFITDNWPSEFYIRFEESQDPQERAQIACARIDHFIATKGAE
jgi:hypothetical protein